MSFDIRQLRYAIAAADHGSFYRAAMTLGMEQSTLSRNILKLERVVGTKLFVRSRAGVAVTFAGIRFIRSARALVINADQMLGESRMVGQGRAGSLVLGLNSSVSAGNLRATIVRWNSTNPEVDLDGVEADRSVLLAGLNTGEIDIAILLGEAAHNGFRREVFWSERIFVALPTGHPLTEHDVVHWTDLRTQRFALPVADPGPDIRDMLVGRLAASGAPLSIHMCRSSRDTVLSLLGNGGYASVVCEGSTGTSYPDVVFRPVHGEQGATLTVYSGYWRSDNDNPALKRFLAFVRERFALSFDISENGRGDSMP